MVDIIILAATAIAAVMTVHYLERHGLAWVHRKSRVPDVVLILFWVAYLSWIVRRILVLS